MRVIILSALVMLLSAGVVHGQTPNDSLTFETSPEFHGGTPNFTAFVKSNLKLSKKQKKELRNQRIFIQFVVDAYGKVKPESVFNVEAMSTITNVDIIRMVEEVIQKSPDWKPGTKEGDPVEMKMMIPLLF